MKLQQIHISFHHTPRSSQEIKQYIQELYISNIEFQNYTNSIISKINEELGTSIILQDILNNNTDIQTKEMLQEWITCCEEHILSQHTSPLPENTNELEQHNYNSAVKKLQHSISSYTDEVLGKNYIEVSRQGNTLVHVGELVLEIERLCEHVRKLSSPKKQYFFDAIYQESQTTLTKIPYLADFFGVDENEIKSIYEGKTSLLPYPNHSKQMYKLFHIDQ